MAASTARAAASAASSLASRVAFVTGGASGLGRATALRFARLGARVAIVDLPSAPGEALAREIGAAAFFAPADVTSEEQVRKVLDDLAARFGAVNAVVQCAGIATATRIFGRKGVHPLAEFERVLRVNTVGTFNVMRLAAERMAAATADAGGERGVIINTASVAAFEGQVGQAAYSASKGAVVGMMLPAARELARSGVRVNTIAPGLFLTPMLEGLPAKVQVRPRRRPAPRCSPGAVGGQGRRGFPRRGWAGGCLPPTRTVRPGCAPVGTHEWRCSRCRPTCVPPPPSPSPGRARRGRPVPVAAGRAGRVRVARRAHCREPLHQRRGHPHRRRAAHEGVTASRSGGPRSHASSSEPAAVSANGRRPLSCVTAARAAARPVGRGDTQPPPPRPHTCPTPAPAATAHSVKRSTTPGRTSAAAGPVRASACRYARSMTEKGCAGGSAAGDTCRQ